jgi:hypothetical protein
MNNKMYLGKFTFANGGLVRLDDDFIVDPRGQLAHPGKRTIIPTDDGRITMKGVPYPVAGMDEMGNATMMMPGGEYVFPGKNIYEIPMAQDGRQVNPELAKFMKAPVNTNDPRYVGSQQATQDKTKVVTPKPKGNPVEEENTRVQRSMAQFKRNVPEGYSAEQIPGALGSMQTVYTDPKTGDIVTPDYDSQQAIINRKDNADMLFNRLNPLTSVGAMAFYGSNKIAQGDIIGGLTETALSTPIAGSLIHGATHLGANRGLISEATVPLLNKRLHQAYEVKHTAGTLKSAGQKEKGDLQPKDIDYSKSTTRFPFIDSDITNISNPNIQNVYGQNQNLPTLPFWMKDEGSKLAYGGSLQKEEYGGDISVPDLRRVKIKKLPSWKKP